MIDIPAAFVQATIAREGERARAWLAGLPRLVAQLLDRWHCVQAGPVMHGFVAIVVPVRCHGGSSAVLKISWPHPGNVPEPAALEAWAGRGAVLLLERDDECFAMLLEQLASESARGLPDPVEAVVVAGRLARRLAVPAPPSLPRLTEVAAHWVEQLPENADRLGRPLPRRVVDIAIASACELSLDQSNTMVHGDLHPGNILRAEREPWMVIDPKGFVGDPAYDTVNLLRYRWGAVAAEPDLRRALSRRLAAFADAAEVDRDRARRWGQARAVMDALWSRAHHEPAAVVEPCDQIACLLA